eukprot:2158978-Pleurochrysis_carterae.AAC.1
MELPSLTPLQDSLRLCESHPQARYTINTDGEVEWVSATSIDSYYIDSEERLSQFLNLHQRGFERGD